MHHHIGGTWTPAASGRTYQKLNPWTAEPVFEAAAGDAEDVHRAVAAASDAFPGWSAAPPGMRQEILLRAAETLHSRAADVRDLLAVETGCGAYFAGVQTRYTVTLLRQAAALAYQPVGQVIPSDLAGTHALALRRPVGVVGAIAPWNAALALSGRAVAGPLALGNTVVLKPSEESPVSGGALWAELFAEAGLPPGVLNVVTHGPGEAGTIARELIASPQVRRLSFTGATATGRRLAEAAGRHLKRVLLQLSGQSPLIILADVAADLDHAVDAAAYGAFVHQGQVCMCARRIYVERPIAREFLARFAARAESLPVGDPRDPDTVVGPLINRWALSQVSRRVNEAVASGARLVAGGTAAPPCYPATILTDVPPDTEMALDETLGPVVTVHPVDTPAEAVRLANASPYGLSAGVLAGTPDHGLHIATQLEAGIVHVNDQPVHDEPQMPFGGLKDSGWGRFGIGLAAEEFTETQWLTARTRPRTYPF